MIARIFEPLGAFIWHGFQRSGAILHLGARTLRQSPSALRQRHRLFVQMARIGYESLPIAAAVVFFTGLVLALHSGVALRAFRAEEKLATIVALSMVKEMGPILTGMLIVGRIGAAIAAELGTMSVNEEIDALHTLGVSPIRYLVVPRFLAMIVMLPVLVIYANLIGIGGGAVMAANQLGVSYTYYFRTVMETIKFKDVMEGLIKAFFFGAIISVVACQYGLTTRGGAQGVGKAITRAVVASFVALFICDYFITRFMNY